MKSQILTLLLFFSSFFSYSQCTMESISLDNRLTKSTVVVEGKIVSQYCEWDMHHRNIYTINAIEIFRVFKGTLAKDTIKLVTEGGRIGNEMLKVSPSLELFSSNVGVFMLLPSDIELAGEVNTFRGVASNQSFIKYNALLAEAQDANHIYTDIEAELYPSIRQITGEPIVTLKEYNPSVNKGHIRALSPPTISSISATNVTAGTSTVLTINGSNFGTTRGTGQVGFRDADFGDGRFYYSPTSWVYQVWSDTKIKVIVPTRAGTGKIRVVNSAGDYIESPNDLIVEWSHENIVPTLSASAPYYETAPRSINGSGGYTLKYTSRFAAQNDAVKSFGRALEEWRCETGINWVLGSYTDKDTVERDSTNTVSFSKFDDGRKAVCYSRYSSCVLSGSNAVWYLSEFDVEFDSTVNWYYGTGAPASNKYDFESFAAHELGHAHQLNHVADSHSVMYFNRGIGERRPDLIGSDIDAGYYYIRSNRQLGGCVSGMTALPLGNCVMRVPTSNFEIDKGAACPNESILFTNTSLGDVQGYEWIFGADASLVSSVTPGPHLVSFATPGTKEVLLVSHNLIGADTARVTILVKRVPIVIPEYLGADTACLGNFNMAVEPIIDISDYFWKVESGGNIVKDGISKITVFWSEPGLHKVTVGIQTSCGVSPTEEIEVYVREPSVAAFESETDSLTVKFFNKSTNSTSFLWTFGDGRSSTEKNPTHTYNDALRFQVQLQATAGCNSDAVIRSLDLNKKLSVVEFERPFVVFPNPLAKGEILHVSGEVFDTYRVYALSGKLVDQGKVQSNMLSPRIQAEGLYLLVLQNRERVAYHKLKVME